MSSASQRLTQLNIKAKSLKQTGRFHQARQKYLQVLRQINIKDVDYIDYIVVMSQLGDVERILQMNTDAKKRYIEGLNLLNKAQINNKNVSQYEIQKERYHLYSNLGLAECNEAQKITEKIREYSKFRQIIDRTLNYYKECQKIGTFVTIQSCQHDINSKFIQDQEEKPRWWKKQFISLIVNLCVAFSQEAFQFQDKSIMKEMLSLIQKAQKFYDLCTKKTKITIEDSLSKCYFYKAVCLKFLNRKSQSQDYFKKDYKYCQQNNLTQDLKKTKIQMFKFYLLEFRFNEARKYALGQQYIDQINHREKQFINIMRKAQQMKKRSLSFGKIQVEQLESILFELHDLNCPQKALDFNKTMRNSIQFKQNIKFRYWLEYYAAENLVKLQKFSQAYKYLKQAIKYSINQPTERAWCSLLNAIILDNLQKDRNKVFQAYKTCVKESNQSQDKDCKIQCQKQFENFRFKQARRKKPLCFQGKEFERVLQFMRQQKRKRNESKMNRMEVQNMENQIVPQQMQQQFYQPQRKLVKPLNELQNYLENCKLLNLQPLPFFKQCLRDSKQINLQGFINFESQHLVALLNSTNKITNLDLTSIVLTPHIIKNISQSVNGNNFTSIKINFINASIMQERNKTQFYEEFCKLLKSNQIVDKLVISNAYQTQKITKMITSKDINCLQFLTVLKLKECQLQDKDLIFLSLGQSMPQLKKLSLANNRLKGNTIEALTSLKQLQTLSLSSNPLDRLKLDNGFQRLKKISLNQLKDSITPEYYSGFMLLLISCEKIKMKFCQQVCTDLLHFLIQQIINYESSLNSLKQLNLFGSHLKEDRITLTLKRFIRKAPFLFSIDLRNCKIICNSNLIETQNELKKLELEFNNQKSQFFADAQKKNMLKTGNLKYIPSGNVRTSRGFSIY